MGGDWLWIQAGQGSKRESMELARDHGKVIDEKVGLEVQSWVEGLLESVLEGAGWKDGQWSSERRMLLTGLW